jgi:predicted amidohydrolase
MRDILIATVQFEHSDGDKLANLNRIEALSALAAQQDAEIVCFHECSITGYTHLQYLHREQILALAEPLNGPSLERLNAIAHRSGRVVMATVTRWPKFAACALAA